MSLKSVVQGGTAALLVGIGTFAIAGGVLIRAVMLRASANAE